MVFFKIKSIQLLKRSLRTSIPHFLIILLSLLWFSGYGHGEYYQYTDRDGNRYYVDDPSKIPPEYADRLKIYKDRDDHLSDEDKARLDAQEAQQEQINRERLQQHIQKEKELFRCIKDIRRLVPQQPGYISGEYLKSIDEKDEIVTISTWFSVEDWQAWFETEDRKKIQSNIDAIPGITTEYTIYRYIKTI